MAAPLRSAGSGAPRSRPGHAHPPGSRPPTRPLPSPGPPSHTPGHAPGHAHASRWAGRHAHPASDTPTPAAPARPPPGPGAARVRPTRDPQFLRGTPVPPAPAAPPGPTPPLGTPPWPPRRPRVDRPLVATPSPALSPRGLELRHLRAREPVATSPELGTPLAPGTYVPTGANPRGTVLGPSPGPFPPLCLSFPSRRGLDLRGTGLWDSPGDTRVAKHPPPRSTHRCQPWGHTTGCHRRWQRPR